MSFSRYSNDIPRITEEEEEDDNDPVPRRVLEKRISDRTALQSKPPVKDIKTYLQPDSSFNPTPTSPAPWSMNSISPRATMCDPDAGNSGVFAISQQREAPEEQSNPLELSRTCSPGGLPPDPSPGTSYQLPQHTTQDNSKNNDMPSSWKSRVPKPFDTPVAELAPNEKENDSEDEAPPSAPPRHESLDTRSNYSRNESTCESSSSKNSTKYSDHGSFMISHKMMEKLAMYDSVTESSFGSTEEFKPSALTSEKKWPGLSKDEIKRRKKAGFYGPWYSPSRYSTRFLILFIAGVICFIVISIGLSIGLWKRAMSMRIPETSVWKPAPGTTWQIQLGAVLTDPTYSYAVYDIDLFDTNASDIAKMRDMGRRVICYFSAGTYESWRSDAHDFPNNTLGSNMSSWEGERYVDYRDSKVRDIMAKRIKLAKKNGCDGIDPDNVDTYLSSNSGFKLTADDAVDFIQFMATQARDQKLAIGLKNAPQLAKRVVNDMQWAVTESCAQYKECSFYQVFVEAGRPVFHIEYPDATSTGVNASMPLDQWVHRVCTAVGTHGFSTLVKKLILDQWSLDCPFFDSEVGYV